MDDPQARLDASRALSKYIPKHMDAFTRNGHAPGSTIVVALESDTVVSVLARVIKEVAAPPATVAVYWPTTSELEVIRLAPGGPITAQTQPIGPGATIGMLIADMRNRADSVTFASSVGAQEIHRYDAIPA